MIELALELFRERFLLADQAGVFVRHFLMNVLKHLYVLVHLPLVVLLVRDPLLQRILLLERHYPMMDQEQTSHVSQVQLVDRRLYVHFHLKGK